MKKDYHHLLLAWMILTGLILFALFVTWREDILILLFAGDKSRISWAITLLYLIVTLHCCVRTWYLSKQLNLTMKIENLLRTNEKNLAVRLDDGVVHVNGSHVLPDSVLSDYLHDLIYKTEHESINNNSDSSRQSNELLEVYEARLKKPHDAGWFCADVMVKLGLLGTIVGFVLMLGTVSNVTDFDLSTVQKILKHMSSGMGTALFTTFAGLVCSILAGLQYHMLDRGADDIIDAAKHLSSVYILPKLNHVA